MDCRQAALGMQELLDGALGSRELSSIRAHLAACPSCAKAYRTYAALAKALAAMPVFSLSEQARARILAAWAAQQSLRAGRFWLSAAGLSLASAVMAVGIWVLDQGLTMENGLAALKLVSDPRQAWAELQFRLHSLGSAAAGCWSQAAAWLRPYVVTLSAGTALTVALFAVVLSAFLVFSLFERARSGEPLGRYL